MSKPGPELFLVASLDVEEEGLFGGRYARRAPSVANTARLAQLEPLCAEGLRPTLFCAHSVLTDPASCAMLARLRDRFGAEIGAHLHHWNTPPLTVESVAPADAPTSAEYAVDAPPDPAENADVAESVPAAGVPLPLMAAKLARLFKAGRDFQGAPLTSFRMGRWDLKSVVRPLLAEAGISVDSSVCPLRAFKDGADHFLAPPDPYWVEDAPGCRLLEAPITQIPLWPAAARLWHGLAARNHALLDSFHFWGALSANPVWHGSRIMRLAARSHVSRGGKVLSLFWHSSEMLPGASPHVPDEAAAAALLEKIRAYLQWLKESFDVRGVTAAQLYEQAPALNFSSRPAGKGDW